MDIKILIATQKKYRMPTDECYLPIHVGKNGKNGIGYIGDDMGDNISSKNPYYCELTGLYWAWKNLKCDYIGLAHYRRYLDNKNLIYRILNGKFISILSEHEVKGLLKKYDVILPKKRRYYIETLYSHYAHTHYVDHLDKTREIIINRYPEYIGSFDKVMRQKSGHMFNMFIMKKGLADKYCDWLFSILFELENNIDISQYDSYQARLFGRVSELLLNVWIEKNNVQYAEISHIHMEKINWFNKIYKFLKAKFIFKKFDRSF
jgi:hypothetical protein